MELPLAWLEWNGILYWTYYQRRPFEPRTVVTALIEEIWARYPGSAHFILRSRIYTTDSPSELCRGMVVVCAKRMSRVPAPQQDVAERMKNNVRSIFLQTSGWQKQIHAGICDASAVPLSLAERDRSVECWLVSASGRLLAWGVNSSGRNRTRHAEMNLLHTWWQREGRPLPAGSRLVTTLEPCPMCAGALWECAESREALEVYYQTPDTGSAVRRSVLRNSPILKQCQMP